MSWGLRGRVLIACLFAGLGTATANAGFPDRPVHLIVPFAPGGVTDALARILAQNLSQRWGEPVVVENRPGGNCTVADGYVAHAAPDGYTLGIVLTSHTVAPSDPQYTLNYDPIKSFAPVVMLGTSQDLLVANPTVLPVHSVKELIASAKARPGRIDFGSSGTYTPGYLNMALFMRATEINMQNITYMGSGPMLTAVLGGEVQITFGTVATFVEQAKTGALRALAVSGKVRSRLAPDIPTMLEAASPVEPEAAELIGSNTAWYGVLAPAGTPDDIVAKLHDDFVAAMNDPEVERRLAAQSFVVDGRSSTAFADFLRADIAKWSAMRQAGVIH